MRCARSTFLHVIGKNAPALTVASLAMIMTPPAGDGADAGDDAGRRCSAPRSYIFQPPTGRVRKTRVRDREAGDPFAGRQSALGVLAADGLRPAAESNLLRLCGKAGPKGGTSSRESAFVASWQSQTGRSAWMLRSNLINRRPMEQPNRLENPHRRQIRAASGRRTSPFGNVVKTPRAATLV